MPVARIRAYGRRRGLGALRDAIAPTVGQALVVGLHPVQCRTRCARLREFCLVIPMGPWSPIACIHDVVQCSLCERVSVNRFVYSLGFDSRQNGIALVGWWLEIASEP